MLHLSNNLKEKKRNINIDLAVLPSHDSSRVLELGSHVKLHDDKINPVVS